MEELISVDPQRAILAAVIACIIGVSYYIWRHWKELREK